MQELMQKVDGTKNCVIAKALMRQKVPQTAHQLEQRSIGLK
jgi:hypothetical protein